MGSLTNPALFLPARYEREDLPPAAVEGKRCVIARVPREGKEGGRSGIGRRRREGAGVVAVGDCERITTGLLIAEKGAEAVAAEVEAPETKKAPSWSCATVEWATVLACVRHTHGHTCSSR